MNTNLTIHRSGTGPAGRRAGRAPSLPFPAIHPQRQPAIPDEGRSPRNIGLPPYGTRHPSATILATELSARSTRIRNLDACRPNTIEPGSHCTPTAGGRFCRGPMAWFPRRERHLPQQTHRSQPRDDYRSSTPQIPSGRATEVAIPRRIGPRKRLCEQARAANRWP